MITIKSFTFIKIFAALLLFNLSHGACSFSWESSKFRPFKNVTAKGCLLFSEKIADLKLSNGEILPVTADFLSSSQTSSHYLGYKWFFNITDSVPVKNEANQYAVILSNGEKIIFGVLDPVKKIYGNDSWKLSERGSRIDVAGSCGVSLSFQKGKIQKYKTSSGLSVNFMYEDGRLSSINEDGKPLASFAYGENSMTVSTPQNGNSPVKIYFENITGGGRIVKAVERGTETTSFEYGFEKNRPFTAKCIYPGGSFSEYEFDGKSGTVRKERSHSAGHTRTYSYHELPDGISRRGSNGDEDLWQSKNGITKEKINGGPTVTKYKIMSGNAIGKVRKEIVEYPDGQSSTTIFSYDDRGNIFMEIRDGKIVKSVKYDYGKNTAEYFDGSNNFICRKEFDDKRRVILYENAKMQKFKVSYLENGEFKIYYSNERNKNAKFASAGKNGGELLKQLNH